MTYANYHGWNYMGIDRPALVRAFKQLRESNFTARLGRSLSDGNSMHSDLRYGSYRRSNGVASRAWPSYNRGAVWTLTSDENLTWMENWGTMNANSGYHAPLSIYCTGFTVEELDEQDLSDRNRGPGNAGLFQTTHQVADYVFRVLESYGLHPYFDERDLYDSPTRKVIKLAASTRLDAMNEDDRETQRNRLARYNEIVANVEAEADAREARRHEDRIQGYIDRYTDALCDQSILRMNSGSGGGQDVVEFMEERQRSINSFLNELAGLGRRDGSRFTPSELARIVTSGASRADERLRAMRNDVIDGGDHGNARAAELILIPSRMRSTAPVAFPWLT